MKKLILQISVAIFLLLFANTFAQTYQLTGNPVNTTGWSLVPSATVNQSFIKLTSTTDAAGAIKLNEPINLKYCNKWKVEFDARIVGENGFYGDGIAFWYLVSPPTSYTSGNGLGIPNNAAGLMVGLDMFDNGGDIPGEAIHILYGSNNVANGNIEFNNTPGSTYHYYAGAIGPGDTVNKHIEVTGVVDSANPNNWFITVKVNGNTVISQSFAPSGGAVGMTQGYFGFSASNGFAKANNYIRNVKIYIDKVNLLQDTISSTVATNTSTINLTSFENQFVSTPADYTFIYYIQGSSTPIANPSSFTLTNNNTTIVVMVKDPSGNLCDSQGILNITKSALGTNETSLDATSIFPNPTRNDINIKTSKKIKRVTIYDASGRYLTQALNSYKIDISSYNKGVYFIQVEFTDGNFIKEKIVKE